MSGNIFTSGNSFLDSCHCWGDEIIYSLHKLPVYGYIDFKSSAGH